MHYENIVMVCAKDILKGALDAGWRSDLGDYELTVADLAYLRGERPDSPYLFPFADDLIQHFFEREVEQEINYLLGEVQS
jgi:hypothetical protein